MSSHPVVPPAREPVPAATDADPSLPLLPDVPSADAAGPSAMALGVAAPERAERVRLLDGRRLAWCEWGPADGLPLVLCPGAGTSGSLGFGTHVLHELGVRLLSVDRPGLGASDRHRDKTLDSWASDVAALTARCELRGVQALGFSQGAPFALALGGRGVARAVTLVAGQDDVAYPPLRALLPPQVGELVDAVQRAPDDVEARFAVDADAEGMWRLVLDTSGPDDRAFFRQPAFAHAYRRALEEAFVGGGAGYARDLVVALGPWPVPPERVGVPVDLWYGGRDASPVHSPDHGATLARRLPRSTRRVLPDEGSALLWTRAAEVLGQVVARGERD